MNFKNSLKKKVAQKIAQAFSPALILLEITLPDIDGYSVCFELKRNPKTLHIPVFIVSSIDNKLSNSEYAVRIAFKHHADRFIAKPIGTKELLKIIMEIF
jgi:CheY-like chemotaxis protein